MVPNKNTLIFGDIKAPIIVNYLILLAKEYIINKKLNSSVVNMREFKRNVKWQYKIDRHVALKNKRLEQFSSKWERMKPWIETADAISENLSSNVMRADEGQEMLYRAS